jgi:hypothetical protein
MTRSIVLAATLSLVACSAAPIPCETDDDCPGCCRPNARGDLFCSSVCPCDSDADCGAGALCVLDATGQRICMNECPPSRETTCADGTVCADLGGGDRICWPGGSTPLGAECAGSAECRRGAICVAVGTMSATCVEACEFVPPGEGMSEACPGRTMCLLTTSGRGFCPPS